MIFDEIDRGVGGAVASAIGERLARLAERTQVLVVTHSPQVAARGSHHFFIAKSIRRHRHAHRRPRARRGRAPRGNRPHAVGRDDHRRSARAGRTVAGSGLERQLERHHRGGRAEPADAMLDRTPVDRAVAQLRGHRRQRLAVGRRAERAQAVLLGFGLAANDDVVARTGRSARSRSTPCGSDGPAIGAAAGSVAAGTRLHHQQHCSQHCALPFVAHRLIASRKS